MSSPTSTVPPSTSLTSTSTVQEPHNQASQSHPENGSAHSQAHSRPEIAMDLRHMTSAGALNPPSSRRVSQRIGSRSPASIPSSPTSVHSSSSAIFERDIEPVGPSPPPQHQHHAHSTAQQNPHRIPRVKLEEQAVPSVLDSAAEILAGLQDEGDQMQVAIEAPSVSMFADGGKSPMSLSSRSPSPGLTGGPGSGSLLLGIPASQSSTNTQHTTATIAPSSPPRPNISTNVAKPQAAAPPTQTPGSVISVATPTSAYFSTTSSVADDSLDGSPKTTTRERAPELPDSPDHDVQMVSPTVPIAPPPSAIEGGYSSFSPSSFTFSTSPPRSVTTASSYSPPHSIPSSPGQGTQTLPASPSQQKVAKRLSFMSYTDLLTSTPLSTVPLSSLTNSVEPPPHIPPVAGYPADAPFVHHTGSNAPSIKNSPRIAGVKEREMLDDLGLIGGEWEREGLGKGLEERLDAIVGMGPPSVVGRA